MFVPKQLPELPRSSTSDVVFYRIGTEAVLFSQSAGRLYRLNNTAAFVWCCLEDGLSPLAISGEVAGNFGCATGLARRDTIRILAQWKSMGLVRTAAPATVEYQHDTPKDRRNTAVPPSVRSPTLVQYEHHYRLLDVHLLVRYPCQATEAHVHPILAHLEVPGEGIENVVILDIAEAEGCYSVLRDGISVIECDNLLELGPVIQREAMLSAYEATDCLAAIHAAAVCTVKNKCILLPGAKGSGKSTLTAALIGAGLTYLTDELSLLIPGTRLIRPARVSLGLKRGSWPILASSFSFLVHLLTHRQQGNVEVRYLPPPKDKVPSRETYPVECLVFPKYQAGGPTILTSLSTADALCRIAEAGYAVPASLDANRVEQLIDWIAQLDCFELRMGDLSEAVYKVKELPV
jgi:hypothetical protein